jgi:hypothetical protein
VTVREELIRAKAAKIAFDIDELLSDAIVRQRKAELTTDEIQIVQMEVATTVAARALATWIALQPELIRSILLELSIAELNRQLKYMAPEILRLVSAKRMDAGLDKMTVDLV